MGSIPFVASSVRKTGDGEIPRSGCPQIGQLERKAVMARKQVGLCGDFHKNESCPGGSGALARSTWLSWGVFIWRQMKPEQSTPASGRKTRRRKAKP